MQVVNMGQYAHGNQPIQHMIYLYNYAGQPWKTQYWVREAMRRLYYPTPDGYCGDEDNGQTSAWYIMSALGFYSVCPGTDQYVLGAPLYKRPRYIWPTVRPLNCQPLPTAMKIATSSRLASTARHTAKLCDPRPTAARCPSAISDEQQAQYAPWHPACCLPILFLRQQRVAADEYTYNKRGCVKKQEVSTSSFWHSHVCGVLHKPVRAPFTISGFFQDCFSNPQISSRSIYCS